MPIFFFSLLQVSPKTLHLHIVHVRSHLADLCRPETKEEKRHKNQLSPIVKIPAKCVEWICPQSPPTDKIPSPLHTDRLLLAIRQCDWEKLVAKKTFRLVSLSAKFTMQVILVEVRVRK